MGHNRPSPPLSSVREIGVRFDPGGQRDVPKSCQSKLRGAIGGQFYHYSDTDGVLPNVRAANTTTSPGPWRNQTIICRRPS